MNLQKKPILQRLVASLQKEVDDSALNDNYYFAQYLTMGALVDCRVCLVRAYRDAVQRAVFRAVTVICALRNSAADRLIALRVIHRFDLLCWFAVIMPAIGRSMRARQCIRLFSFIFHLKNDKVFRPKLCKVH